MQATVEVKAVLVMTVDGGEADMIINALRTASGTSGVSFHMERSMIDVAGIIEQGQRDLDEAMRAIDNAGLTF